MKWNLSFIQKAKALGALVMIFLLVLATNLMDNNHFAVVKKSLTTVYEDRLVAKDYIYKIARQLEIKEREIYTDLSQQSNSKNHITNDSISAILSKFKATRLTSAEETHFRLLNRYITKLLDAEKQLAAKSDIEPSDEIIVRIISLHASIANELDVLSEIQMTEGRRQINYSNEAIAKSKFISQLEIGALIVIGVIIQLLIFIKPSR